MGRLAKCKDCGVKLKSNEKHTLNSKTYCKECFEKNKKTSDEYKQLIDFICLNYNINKPTGLILKQIKDLKLEFNYNYSSILYTLWYCKNIKNKELNEKYGIGLVKYYYDEAKNYYLQIDKSKKIVIENEKVKVKTRILKMKNVESANSKSFLIDIENLVNGGD